MPNLLRFTSGFGGPEFERGKAIFEDLGSGTLYGETLVDNGIPPLFGPPPVGPTFEFRLSAEAVKVAHLARPGALPFTLGFRSGSKGMLGIGDFDVLLRVLTSPVPVPEPTA